MNKTERANSPLEMLLWSIAFPGFGQLLNGRLIKGIVLIFLEIIINVTACLNVVIISSFQGEIDQAIAQTNYQWLMFYPCVYMFAIWDAYRDAGGKDAGAFLPFVVAAYFGTIGVIYSPLLFGPVWLPIICLIAGALAGYLIKRGLFKRGREAMHDRH